MADVRLLNPKRAGTFLKILHFYDGFALLDKGVVTIPEGHETWLKRCFQLGYRFDPESGEMLEWFEILARYQATNSPVIEPDSTVSAGEKIESPTPRRQPVRKNRVRQSKLPRS